MYHITKRKRRRRGFKEKLESGVVDEVTQACKRLYLFALVHNHDETYSEWGMNEHLWTESND